MTRVRLQEADQDHLAYRAASDLVIIREGG
jgi:hypothetical protein